jgi:GntR family transcriptional regulator
MYFRVAETIKARIESRQYRPGALIPPEKRLASEFGVSLITIRKAMDLLVREGLVSRKRGVGTWVLSFNHGRLPIKITGNFRDWFDSVSGRLQRLEAEVLEVQVAECPEQVARVMGLEEGAPIWRMRRVRKYRGEPISYYINYGPAELDQLVSASDFRRRSFLEVFQEKFGVRLGRIEQRVEATVADMDVSAILGVDFGSALFFVENVYYTVENRPVEVTHMYYRGDRYVYRASIQMEQGGSVA